MSTIGHRIKERREQMGYTQEELAHLIGASQNQIWRYESGGSLPSVENLIALSRALETTTDWILGESDDLKPFSGDSGLEDDEIELLRIYRAKSADSQHKILEVAKMF